MLILFEDNLIIKIGVVNKTTPSHYLIETNHGKQQKIKTKSILFNFENDNINSLEVELNQANVLANEIDISFVYDCAYDLYQTQEFIYNDLAQEYYGSRLISEQLSLYIALKNNPIYFRKLSSVAFKCAEKLQVEAALIGLAKKNQQQEEINEHWHKLQHNQLPDEWQNNWQQILFDKTNQSTASKALNSFANKHKTTPAYVLKKCGAFNSWEDYHIQKFIHTNYPDQIKLSDQFQELTENSINQILNKIPKSININAFSIDDQETNEIDDAFSITNTDNGYRIGIHIAAPALWAYQNQNSKYYQRLATRIATVYFYSSKNLTKIPLMGERITNTNHDSNHNQTLCDFFSLDEEKQRVVVSLYFNLDNEFKIDYQAIETIIQIINIQTNLRLQQIEDQYNEILSNQSYENIIKSKPYQKIPLLKELGVLYQTAKILFEERQKKGAILTNKNNFRFNIEAGLINITPRNQDLPLDILVSELMILANSYWSELLNTNQIPMVYRIKTAEKMGFANQPSEHKPMAKKCYGWFTSPLRRFVDLCNQQQLIAFINNDKLNYPSDQIPNQISNNLSNHIDYGYNQKLTEISIQANIYHGFYRDFQQTFERYWCLVWLKQTSKKAYQAICSRPYWIDLVDIPLSIKIKQDLIQKKDLMISVNNIDLYELSVSHKILSI